MTLGPKDKFVLIFDEELEACCCLFFDLTGDATCYADRCMKMCSKVEIAGNCLKLTEC